MLLDLQIQQAILAIKKANGFKNNIQKQSSKKL